MIGTLVSLWLWALDNAQDGSLEGVSDKTIARVCDFPEKKAGKLMEALLKHGFVDCDGDHYIIHDWYDYAGKLMDRREKDRERKKKPLKKQQDFQWSSGGNPEEVTGNSYATVPNRTIPYPTQPDISGAAGDTRARMASEEELSLIGLNPGEYPFVTAETVQSVMDAAASLFRKYFSREPTATDCRMVFTISPPGCYELLDYAFEAAAIAGKLGDWRYIRGVMDRLAARGIQTPQQAREWDEIRPDKEE